MKSVYTKQSLGVSVAAATGCLPVEFFSKYIKMQDGPGLAL